MTICVGAAVAEIAGQDTDTLLRRFERACDMLFDAYERGERGPDLDALVEVQDAIDGELQRRLAPARSEMAVRA